MRRRWGVLLVCFALVLTQACGEEGCSLTPGGKSRGGGGGGGKSEKTDKAPPKKKKKSRGGGRRGQVEAPFTYYTSVTYNAEGGC
jgi:hypothetical protein